MGSRQPEPHLPLCTSTRHYPRSQVDASDASKVLCHRQRNGVEEYLVRWKSVPEFPVSPRAICSWHCLDELERCLHHVQTYIETRPCTSLTNNRPKTALVESLKRKREASDEHEDVRTSRDATGLISPLSTATPNGSRSPSHFSLSSSPELKDASTSRVYNGVLQRKEGRIFAQKSKDVPVPTINATKLPTAEMLEEAALASVDEAEVRIRKAFMKKLKRVPNITLENEIDNSVPSLNFAFVTQFVLRDGVKREDPAANEGCQLPCRPHMGQNIGCEYPRVCACLEFAAVNEQAMERQDPVLYRDYLRAKERGEILNTKGLPKRFPYEKPNADARIPSTLQSFYRESRHPIYECNPNCNCGPRCKSRLVQKGRKVPLTIFKTTDRGWGIKCDEDLVPGEFIDTYLGEVITNEETERREANAGKGKASYLYSLDKFIGDDPELTEKTCYVVDGQYMGNPTRFINHSCEPNCRQYTVSYNKHDLRVYELAFFAYEYIPAGTELTFDYMDKDEEEEEEVRRKREEAANDPNNVDKLPCHCRSSKCRGYLWV